MTSDISALCALLEEKIANGEVIEIEMGTAYDEAMDEVQWRARCIPLAIVNSPKGKRLRCRIDSGGRYLIKSASQTDGDKLLIIGRFKIVG